MMLNVLHLLPEKIKIVSEKSIDLLKSAVRDSPEVTRAKTPLQPNWCFRGSEDILRISGTLSQVKSVQTPVTMKDHGPKQSKL